MNLAFFLSPPFSSTNKIVSAQMVLCNVPYNVPNVKACRSLLSQEISVYALMKVNERKIWSI